MSAPTVTPTSLSAMALTRAMSRVPRMRVPGPALGITEGHCDNNLLPSEFHYKSDGVADGPWAARAKVRDVVKYGADVICASGGVLSKGDQPGTPQFTLEEMQSATPISPARSWLWH